MKNVYSNLYAMRAIVCVAHERVSDEHPYNFPFSIFNFQLVVNVKWKIENYGREDSLQNAEHCHPTVFCLYEIIC